MKKFSGKKLLVLGSNVGSVDIVSYAKQNGAYTIVVDNLPPEKSPAKMIADEHLMISTANTLELNLLINNKKIDGIMAGISEFNLIKAIELCENNKKPFYCTLNQWNQIESKDNFRKLCIKNSVPVPKTFFIGKELSEKVYESIIYPVVVKPVDSSASLGVHICNNEEELIKFSEEAVQISNCHTIIIEEYVEGTEFTAHYTISNGTVTLSCVDNRYPIAVHEGTVTTVPIARIYPCLYLDEYIQQVDPFMKRLCKELNLTNAILFIQGIYNKDNNRFYIFESGLRCAGEAPYRFLSVINGINAMNMLVDHALSEKINFDAQKEDPTLAGKCCGIVSFVAKGGVVGKIIGLEEAVNKTSSVIEYESRYPVGSVTPDGDTLRQLMIRFVMICENRNQMSKDIAYLNDNIKVLDKDGQNMVLKINPKRVYDIF